MPNVLEVTLANGIPIAPSGPVSTLDALMADGGQATIGTTTDPKSSITNSGSATLVALVKNLSSLLQTLAAAVVALGQANSVACSPVVLAPDQSGAGFDFVPKTIAAMTSGTSGNVANAPAVTTIGGTGGKRTFITGISCTASGSTSGLAVVVTLTGPVGAGTLDFIFTFPAGVLVAAQPLNLIFDPPLVTALNGAAILTLPAGGSGNTNACASIYGFVQ